ncbi:hypothetical protein [Frigoriglobus tundricola]|nr:hypothetical protein [Frigoriglobus tundricola]
MFDPKAKCAPVEPSSSMQQCIDAYGVEGQGEWVNNTLSQQAQFWSCGMISRRPSVPTHDHDPRELARCHTLANEAARVMGSVWCMFRSGSDPETHPFFITVQHGEPIPTRIDEPLIRKVLGGTLHPEAAVRIEPLAEGTTWWQEVEEDARSMVDDQPQNRFEELVKEWRDLMKWFSVSGLSDPSFVRTTDPGKPCRNLGCVFPCFVMGVSDKGSLIGIATHVVE